MRSALGDRLALSLRPRLERFMLPLISFIASVSAWVRVTRVGVRVTGKGLGLGLGLYG